MIKIRSGYEIKGYVLKEMIGFGGFATVYKAETIVPISLYNPVIAVKVLHPRRLNRIQIHQFLREGKIAKNLEHPNVVRIFDIVNQDGNFFILMEYLDSDLMKAIKTKRYIFTPKNIKEVIIKAARGINYIHNNGIIHKDINPSNILITYSLDKVKVSDFGLAKKDRRFFKRTEIRGGTEGFIAPEFFKGRRIDERSDIYSFGKTIEKIYQELRFSIPEKIRHIIKIATDPLPENRFESMEGILYILENMSFE